MLYSTEYKTLGEALKHAMLINAEPGYHTVIVQEPHCWGLEVWKGEKQNGQ